MKDFNTYAFCGFVNSMVVVPPFYLKKEDSVGQEGMNVDWTDEDAVSDCKIDLGQICSQYYVSITPNLCKTKLTSFVLVFSVYNENPPESTVYVYIPTMQSPLCVECICYMYYCVLSFNVGRFLQVKAAMDKILSKMRAGYKKSPMIKTMIAGNFLDMVDRGIIKLG